MRDATRTGTDDQGLVLFVPEIPVKYSPEPRSIAAVARGAVGEAVVLLIP